MIKNHFKVTQYACAVVLIVSSIALAFLQAVTIETIAQGVLIYIAQAFLLAASIFGLDYYIRKLNNAYKTKTGAEGHQEQQPA